jgi:DNA-directed RNA polymerase specialized sigma subunit
MSPKPDKEALKQLRSERKVWIDRARQTVKAQNAVIKAIKDQLAEEPRTVPQMAQALKMKTSEVLLYIAALRKYGEVVEGPKEDDYFQYQLVQ